MVLISGLTPSERGLACRCKCPTCNGDLVAKMGSVKKHHFAHHKDACDSVKSYVNGLYKFLLQVLEDGDSFYVPSLTVEFTYPRDIVLNENTVSSYVRFISEERYLEGEFLSNRLHEVFEGRHIIFDTLELHQNKNGRFEAIEATRNNNTMAIKIRLPSNLCKGFAKPVKHKEMATLMVDFEDDLEVIQNWDKADFERCFLSEDANKRWVYNPKVSTIFPLAIRSSHVLYRRYMARKALEEQARKAEEQRLRKEALHTYEDGLAQVQDKFTQQHTQIRDSCDYRWVKCENCGKIGRDNEFSLYGGIGRINLGICSACNRESRNTKN